MIITNVKSQNAENGTGTNGQITFYLPEFEVKFETKKWGNFHVQGI
jgi:hypothetical protein